MTEFGYLVEKVESVLGPLKRRVVQEEWHDHNMEVVSIVPRYACLTVLARCGTKVICSLRQVGGGNVDVDRGQW